MTVRSGHGVHAYWRLKKPIRDLEEWVSIQRRLIATLRADPHVKDAARIMRLAGFVNHKRPVANCYIVRSDPSRVYTLKQILLSLRELDTENTEPSEALSSDSVTSSVSGCADGNSVSTGSVSHPTEKENWIEETIKKVMPKEPVSVDDAVLDLARGVKFNCGMANATPGELRSILHRWYKRAKQFIGEAQFDDVLATFFRAFDNAKYPLGANVIDEAASRIRKGDLPKAAHQYTHKPIKMLVGLCSVLADNRGKFFLGCRDAGRVIGVTAMRASIYLQMLVRDGVIILLRKGAGFRASRYQFVRRDSCPTN